jgi:hypothetical protein
MLHCESVTLKRSGIAIILAICIGGPIVEMFDSWDHTLQDGNDTEANVVVVALCVGLVLSVATTVVIARIRALAATSRPRTDARRPVHRTGYFAAVPTPTVSPPTPLRV